MSLVPAVRAVLLAGLLSVGFAGSAAPSGAATCAGPDVIGPSCFEGADGNLVVDGGATRLDWVSVGSTTITDSTGSTDTQFGGGNSGKEMDPKHWVLNQGSNQQKLDVVAAATKSDPVSGHVFFYGAFHRVGDSGNTNLSFELNASGEMWDNDGNAATPKVPTRSEGDLLITFDGGAGNVVVGACKWHGNREGESSNPLHGWYTLPGYPAGVRIDSNTNCTKLSTTSAPKAAGNMNAANLPNGDPDGAGPRTAILEGFGNPIGHDTMGEMVVDLTAALTTLGDPSPCFAFGSFWLHSRSSDTVTSQMGDYVAPGPIIGAASCSIDVDKRVAVGTEGAHGPYLQGADTPAGQQSWATVGDWLHYELKVTNNGAAPITGLVVTDLGCDGPAISLADKLQAGAPAPALDPDSSPATFDAGDVWTYRCKHLLGAADPATYVNTVNVAGVVGTKALSDSDSATTRKKARVYLKKDVRGAGADTALSFGFTATGFGAASASRSEADGFALLGSVLPSGVPGAPAAYGVTEPAAGQPAGYAFFGAACKTAAQGGSAYAGAAIEGRSVALTLGSGDDVYCTFVNDKDTTLRVIKTVVNDDGGTAGAGAWTMNISGQSPSSATVPGTAGDAAAGTGGQVVKLEPGTFAVTETLNDSSREGQYEQRSATGCSGTIELGQALTCEIVNDDVAPVITVVKRVVNDDGGTAAPGDFTMVVDAGGLAAPDPDGKQRFAGVSDVAPHAGTAVTADAGPVEVTEEMGAFAGQYSASASADCDTTLQPGDHVTCVLTNDDRPATLVVTKTVHNDFGGHAGPGDFAMHVAATAPSASSFDGSASGTTVDLDAGAYTVTESPKTEYAATGYSLESASAGCSGTILPGQTKSCDIVNQDEQPRLTVIKDVVNRNGSSASASDFQMDVTATQVDDAHFPGSSAGVTVGLDEGTYSVDESGGPGGFAKSLSGGCSGTVKVGQTRTCTITNTRQTGTIEIVKALVPSDDPGRFDLQIDGADVLANAGNGSTTGAIEVDPDSHTVGEAEGNSGALADYASHISCASNGGEPVTAAGPSMDIAIEADDHVTCEITNTRLGTIVIGKVTSPVASVPSDGAFDFRPSESLGVADFGLLDGETRTIHRVAPNAGEQDDPYVVAEGDELGYRLTAVQCSDGDSTPDVPGRRAQIRVSPGETVTCTFTNLALDIDVNVDKTGTSFAHHGDTVTFTFTVTNGGNAPLHDVSVTDEVSGHTVCTPSVDSKPENSGDPNELDPGDVWVFKCSYALPADHPANGESGGVVVNTAVVSAVDEQSRPVQSPPDSHSTTIYHPAIELTKLVRRQGTTEFAHSAVVHQGDVLEYVVDAVNTGDAPLTLDPVADDHCTLSGPSKVTGDGDGSFEPAERWRWTCDIPVTASVDDFTNTASVSGHDPVPGPAGAISDTDTASAEVLRPKLAIVKTQRIQGTGAPFSDDPVSGHLGDKVEYRIAVTNTGDTPLVNVAIDDGFCDAAPDGPADAGALGVGETRIYTCEHTLDTEDSDAFENVATATGEDRTGHPAPPVSDTVPGTILRPSTLVVKEGNVFAYPGDSVTYTFAVRTSGNAPLSDVSVSDDRCAPVSAAPVAKSNDDGDALLETGEVWTFSCTSTIPASHSIGDVNPLHNIATATAKDPLGLVVTATDDHDTTVLHPAIAIDKQGAAQATAGARLDYALVVTNPGDVSFPAQQVVVTDPRCDAPALFVAARRGEAADESPDRFDPGDTRLYTCSVQTTAEMVEVLNTATVVGTDAHGHKVSASDELVTQLNRAAVAAAQLASPGTSRLAGPSSCVTGPFTMRVRGQNVATVAVFIDGKRYRRIVNTANRTSFAVPISPKGRSRGVHKVRVLVSYTESSQTRAKTMRLNFQRCAAKVVRPRYTG